MVAVVLLGFWFIRPNLEAARERELCQRAFRALQASASTEDLQRDRPFTLILTGREPSEADLRVEWLGTFDLASDRVVFDFDGPLGEEGAVMFEGSTILIRTVSGEWESGQPASAAVPSSVPRELLADLEPKSALDPRHLIESVLDSTEIGITAACESDEPDGTRVIDTRIPLGGDEELVRAKLRADGALVELLAFPAAGGTATFTIEDGTAVDQRPAG